MKPLDGWIYVEKHGPKVVQKEPLSGVIQREFNCAISSKIDILQYKMPL